jgi:PAS domain S-box-containing protein
VGLGRIAISVKDRTGRAEREDALREEIRALRKEVKDLARLHDAGWRLRQAESLREGLAEVLSATIDLLDADMGDVHVADDKGRLHIAAQFGFERHSVDFFRDLSIEDETACARAFRSGEPITVEDIELDATFASYRSAARVAGYRAFVSAPLIGRHGTLLGIVSTHFRSPHRPTDTDLKRLELYRRRAADFIEHIRSDEALRESSASLAAEAKAMSGFYRAGLRSWEAVSIHEGLNEILSGILDLLDSDMGSVQLLDTDGKILRIAAHSGFKQDFLEFSREISAAQDTACGRALRTGDIVVVEDVELDATDAALRSVRRAAGYRAIVTAPLINSRGTPLGMISVHFRSPHRPSASEMQWLELYRRRTADFIDQFRSEQILRDSEERLRLAMMGSQIGMWDWDLKSETYFWNDQCYHLFGYRVGEVAPSRAIWVARVHPDDLGAAQAALASARKEGREYRNEYRVIYPDGRLRWIRARGRFLYQGGEPVRMIGLTEDVTSAQEQVETQRVLVAELQHRTRNLMAVVQSIADQTLDSVDSLADFQRRFNSRLEALSRVQSLLSRADDEPITLGALVAMELEAIGSDAFGDRITFSGPEAPLRKSAVEMLSLAIHELLTNAIKYGALAGQSGGLLSVTWHIEGTPPDGRLVLDWAECGIAAQAKEARRNGYGRTLIEEALPYSISAETKFELGSDGLRCRISLPLAPNGAGEAAE